MVFRLLKHFIIMSTTEYLNSHTHFFQEANDILIIPTRVLERDTGKPGAAAEATLIHETNLQRKQCSQYSS